MFAAWRADPLEMLDATVAGFGGERRDGQRELAAAVADAMVDGHHLVAEAPTGSGKSLAYLAPAVASGLKVVVATSTIALQSQLVGKDLPALRQHGSVPFTFALLKGRSQLPVPRQAARGRRARRAVRTAGRRPGSPSTSNGFAEFAETSATGDRSELHDADRRRVVGRGELHERRVPGQGDCADGDECFAELARDARGGASSARREPRALLRAPRVAKATCCPTTTS